MMLNKILENYQIKITKYLDGSYVKANFSKDNRASRNVLQNYEWI